MEFCKDSGVIVKVKIYSYISSVINNYSVLGAGFAIKEKTGPQKRKLRLFFFMLLLLGISTAAIGLTVVSVMRWRESPTGTSVEYRTVESDLNISITFCEKLFMTLDNTSTKLTNLFYIYSKKTESSWDVYHDEKTHNQSDLFFWIRDNAYKLKCRTVRFPGEEVKIVHRMAYNTYTDTIFLHDSGYLNGINALHVSNNLFANNNFLLLDLKQIEMIEEENNCMNTIEFDRCRDDFINQEMNATIGCVLMNKRKVFSNFI